MDTTNLDVVLGSDLFKLLHVLGELWELDVDRSSECSSKVSWAGCDVTQMVVMSEFSDFLNGGSSTGKAVENGCNVSTWLHRDNSELILFVNPDKEGLVIVVENSSARWPVTVKSASFEETVTFSIIDLIVSVSVGNLKSTLEIKLSALT